MTLIAPILRTKSRFRFHSSVRMRSHSSQNWTSSSCSVRAAKSLCLGSSSSPVVWPLMVMLNCSWEEGFFSASLSIRMPLPSRSPSFSRCHILPHRPWRFLCSPSPLEPFTPPCVTGFFLITDPSSCYYSNPLLYNMPFYMRFHKGPIWSEGYGARSWEMQLHGGNLCLGQNGGLTSSLLMHSSGHSGPSLTCWAHWIR